MPISLKDFDPGMRMGLKQITTNRLTKSRVESIQEIKGIIEEWGQKCREWCELNLIDADALSDIDCMMEMTDLLLNPSKIQLYRNQLKKDIAKEYKDSKKLDVLRHLLEVLKRMNAPILTTNFETYMSSSLLLERKKMGAKFTDFYPWNVYFSDVELESPVLGVVFQLVCPKSADFRDAVQS